MLRKLFSHNYNQKLSIKANRFNSFLASDLTIKKHTNPKPLPQDFHSDKFLAQLPFGALPTPHILQIDWDSNDGWGKPYIEPHGEDNMMKIPAGSAALHYGTQCFEGMKAYYQKDFDRIAMFRPDMNAKRFQYSSETIALNRDFDWKELVECIRALIDIDRDWVPKNENGSIYIRPTHIAYNSSLGVAAPNKSKIFVMLTPVGPYFKTGFQPVDLLVDPKNIRATPHGTGSSKCGGNYGSTIPIQKRAKDEHGCSQVLWLYNDYITEVGTMNFFMMWHRPGDNKLECLTPPLDDPVGSRNLDVILPGVTRDSLLALARDWNEFEVTEKNLKWSDFKQAVKENRVIEAFGAGTACVVCPIGRFFDTSAGQNGEWLEIPSEEQVFRRKFYDGLTDIQMRGKKPINDDWFVIV